MAHRPWLEQLRADLKKRRLPAAYVERLVEEVSDHWDDLEEETMSTQAEREVRMGQPEQVALAAGIAYRQRMLGRRPILAGAIYVLLPLPLLIALWLGLMYVCVSAMEQTGLWNDSRPPAQVLSPRVVHGFLAALGVVSAAVLTAFFGWLARRTNAGGRWALTSGLMLSLVTGLVFQQVHLSELPGQSSIMLGIGLGLLSLWQAGQFFAALAISLLILRWQDQRRPGTCAQMLRE